ncbi:hypothetical protein BDV09DRAFT_191912 [Aspergillus tetrazonus]
MRFIPSLTTLALISRAGIFVSAVITVGLNARFLTNTSWANDLLIYIIVIASFSVLACLVPPYPNFLFDAFWALASALCQAFALVIQFTDSPCYGFRPESEVEVTCSTYKAGTAFAFMMASGWGTSALLVGVPSPRLDIECLRPQADPTIQGLIRIIGVVFNIGQTNRHLPPVQETPNEREAFGKYGNEEKLQSLESIKERGRIKGFGNDHFARIIYAVPAFATYLVNESPLPPLQVSLLHPTNDSILFSASSEIKVPDALTMHLDSMHAEIFRPQPRGRPKEDPIPLAEVDISKLHLKGNQKITMKNQTLKLGDVGQFARLVEDAAYHSTFRTVMHAKTKVGLAGLKTSIDITKEVEMPGFSNFTELAINNLTIRERDDQGNNLFAETVLFNPTPASVTLGDVTLSILAANHSIGTATSSINNIKSGNNTLSIRAFLDGEVLEENISGIIREQIPYLRKGDIKITAAGKSVVYNGQHLEYWETALQAVRVDVTRSVREIVDMVLETLDGDDIEGEDEDDSGFEIFGFEIDIPRVQEGVRSVVEGLVDQILDTAKGLDENEENTFTEELAVLGRLILRLLQVLGVL